MMFDAAGPAASKRGRRERALPRLCRLTLHEAHVCVYIYIYIYTHTHIHTYVRTYVRTYIHTYVHIISYHMYIYIYIHIYIYTYKSRVWDYVQLQHVCAGIVWNPSTGVCEKERLSCEPSPCNTAAEVALDTLIWCRESLASHASSSPEVCFCRRRRHYNYHYRYCFCHKYYPHQHCYKVQTLRDQSVDCLVGMGFGNPLWAPSNHLWCQFSLGARLMWTLFF